VMDTVWGETPLSMAASDGKVEIIKALLDAGARGADAVLLDAAQQGKVEIVQVVLDKSGVDADVLGAALLTAAKPAARELLTKAGAKPLCKTGAAAVGDELDNYIGDYESPNGLRIKAQLKDGRLLTRAGSGTYVLRGVGQGKFEAIGRDT